MQELYAKNSPSKADIVDNLNFSSLKEPYTLVCRYLLYVKQRDKNGR